MGGKTLHLLHHDASGTERDIEERGITNGERWSPKRLLMIIDPVLAAQPGSRGPDVSALRRCAGSPRLLPARLDRHHDLVLVPRLSVAFVTHGAATSGGVLPSVYAVLSALTVVWIGPNVLRVTCLHFISSNMHYFGDVEEGNVIEQTQVLNRWWLAPLQLSAATSAAPTASTTSCPAIRSTSAS